jgi:hypothetical protein
MINNVPFKGVLKISNGSAWARVCAVPGTKCKTLLDTELGDRANNSM